jgi:hypothetical protein
MQQKNIILTFIIIIIINSLLRQELLSQDNPERVKKIDSTYIFVPSETIEVYDPDDLQLNGAHGIQVSFSNSGFGLGYFYHQFMDNNNILFSNMYFSGARNSDEFEYYNYETGQYVIPGKINRLFLIPLSFGYSKILFSNSIAGAFRPFASIALTSSFIISTPYKLDWFQAWSDAKSYVKIGGYAELGAYFRSAGNSVSNVGIRYYYIPFGEPGLESIEDSPITNFGGIVLSLNIGFGF